MSAALIHIADPSVPGGWRPATAADFTGTSSGGGSGDASAAKQDTQITRETEIRDRIGATSDAAPAGTGAAGTLSAWSRWLARGVGAPADSAASSDTGTFSLLAFVKRGLQNWTTLLARIPALVAGRVPVDTGLRGGLSALGFQQITSLSSSSALTVPGGATLAVIQAEGADVRWRDDGTAPTATVGMLLPAGAELRYTGALAALRLIQASAGATVNVSYYA